MTVWEISFAPQISWTLIGAGAGIAALLTLYSIFQRLPGALLRGAALALVLLILANPSLLEEQRDPLPDIVAVVVDRSASQTMDGRADVTNQVAAALKDKLGRFEDLDVRTMQVDSSAGEGTNLFAAVDRALKDTPRAQIAGVLLITDGEVHDAPPDTQDLGFDAPVHVLITGRKDEKDRKLTIEKAPRFGIVGESVTIAARVDDFGGTKSGPSLVTLSVRVDGKPVTTRRILTGIPQDIDINITHGGQNVIELSVEAADDELTLVNNSAVIVTNGIRDRLRVLLVSGEPHAGERTWRDLLKADPSVDLVHFTILRPPEKQDGTPINELSLIPFPTRELFSTKLDDFDLVIFDRYKLRNVLPMMYLGNIARFVEKGGALLTATGPSFATPFSLFRSPLSAVLPSQPTGDIIIRGFKPTLTLAGHRHPVTAGLPGAGRTLAAEPTWGRWFRLIDTRQVSGEALMAGPDGRPLLVLDRVEKGRVAQLMSDHAWLWKRGFEGGGPQGELLRRLAHWLMKEPDLEEEVLSAAISSSGMQITRRTMADTVDAVTVTAPSGATQSVTLAPAGEGLWTATIPVSEMGLYTLKDTTLNAVATAGPLNPKEFMDVRATEALLAPVMAATGGGAFWVREGANAVPDFRRVGRARNRAGRNWAGLVKNERSLVRAVSQTALLKPLIALLLLLGALLMGWRREAR